MALDPSPDRPPVERTEPAPDASSATAPYPVPSHAGMEDVDPWAGWPPSAEPQRGSGFLAGLRGLREMLDVAVLALAMFLAVQLVIANYEVDGASMQPTFQDGERLIVNRLAYRFGDPSAGDVVVFERPNGRDLLKRVIAVEGQTVHIQGGIVYVDGVPFEEPYIAERPADYPPVVVPDGHVFLMGDNRNNSLDSRAFGPVPVDDLVGRADLRYLPFDRLGRVGHADAQVIEGTLTP